MASRHNKTPADIRPTFKRHRLPLPIAGQIDNCKRLCAGWHNRFGACLTLDDQRLRALCRRLVIDQVPVEDCVWAVEAYARYCTEDPWHRDHQAARKTLASFFLDDRFEEWVEKGRILSCRRKTKEVADQAAAAVKQAADQAKADELARAGRIHAWFHAQSTEVQQQLVALAFSRLPAVAQKYARGKGFGNSRSLRTEIGKIMDEHVGPTPSSAHQGSGFGVQGSDGGVS